MDTANIQTSDITSPTLDVVKHSINHSHTVNADQILYNRIKEGSQKEQLKKAAKEFESIFITKMLSEMDKTVDREENGLFGNDNKYEEAFKSIVFQQMGRDLANNPRTTFGFADQIYRQMERYVQ